MDAVADSYDVVIIGGGVTGCSTACFLTAGGFHGSVLVVERDPIASEPGQGELCHNGVVQDAMHRLNLAAGDNTRIKTQTVVVRKVAGNGPRQGVRQLVARLGLPPSTGRRPEPPSPGGDETP